MSHEPLPDIPDLVHRVEEHFLTLLSDGAWKRTDDLSTLIPDHLAEVRARHTRPDVYKDTGSIRYGQATLTEDALKGLESRDMCERRRWNSKDEVRLTTMESGARSTPPVKTTQIPCSSKRPGSTTLANTTANTGPKHSAGASPQPTAHGATALLHRPETDAPIQLVDPDLPIHEVANLFPEVTGAEYERMKASMSVDGQLLAAWVYKGELLDGRTRQKIAKEKGWKLKVREWNGNGSLVNFAASLNLHRRHLDESQRALVAAKMKPMFEAEAKERMLAGRAPDPQANLPEGGQARDKAAQLLNISPRSVESASKVITKGTPVLVQAVEKGEVSVSAAAELADLPPKEQTRTVAKGKAAVRAKVKTLRTRKPDKRHDAATESKPVSVTPADPVQSPAAGETSKNAVESAFLTITRPVADVKVLSDDLLKFLGRKLCAELAELWGTDSTSPKASGTKNK